MAAFPSARAHDMAGIALTSAAPALMLFVVEMSLRAALDDAGSSPVSPAALDAIAAPPAVESDAGDDLLTAIERRFGQAEPAHGGAR
jgi:hypothetical protein